MTTKLYIPRPDTIPAKVLSWFAENPDEELTVDDIALKIGGQRNSLHSNLSMAVDAGALVRERNDDGDYVYRAGRVLPPEQSARPAKASTSLPRVALPDPLTVVIDKGIPVPSSNGQAKRDWTLLLQRLQPGDSAQLPRRASDMLSKCITDMHKAQRGQFTRRIDAASGTVRVWRLK